MAFSGIQWSGDHEMEWESGVDLDDIISMIQLVCLTEEMDWTPQTDPVDVITQSFQILRLVHQEDEMDWVPQDAASSLIELLQGLSLGSTKEEMPQDAISSLIEFLQGLSLGSTEEEKMEIDL